MRVLRYFIIALFIFSFANMGLATTKRKHAPTHVKVTKHKARKSSKKRQSAPTGVQAPYQIVGKEQLTYVLNRIINGTDTNNADVAVYVKSLKTGEVLYARNVYQALTPASIMKILTAEAGLLYLGPNYRFSTQLLTDAKTSRNGVLQGNLYIVLSGDPTLVYPNLVELMINLQERGIRAISGNVYIDNTAYDQRFYGPGWVGKDKTACYGAPISASIINHNCLPLAMQPSSIPGFKAKVVTSPSHFYPSIDSTVVTKSNRRDCEWRVIKSGGKITLDGCLSQKTPRWTTSYVVTDIPEYNRALFKSLLRRLGVDVYGTVQFGSAPASLALLSQHNSEPLTDMIRDMLKKSDNVIAGALFKKIGQLYSNRPGSWENGSLAVSQILAKQTGMQTNGLRLLDGSGLSPDNLATPSQFMSVLQFAYHNPKTSEDFISSLPISGVDGTLKRRLTNITRKIRAKTGTISGVASLAGYASAQGKQDLAFVIMINGNKGLNWRFKGLEDQIVTALTRYQD